MIVQMILFARVGDARSLEKFGGCEQQTGHETTRIFAKLSIQVHSPHLPSVTLRVQQYIIESILSLIRVYPTVLI